jgi:hypothetical protein
MGQKRHEKGTDARCVAVNSQESKQKDLTQLLAWYKRRYVLRVPQAFVHAASVQVLKQLLYAIPAVIIQACDRSDCVGLPPDRLQAPETCELA